MGRDAGQILLDEDLDSIGAASDEKPVLQIYLSGNQSVADNTLTALSFGSENFDSHGFHSTSVNPTRITPNKAGIYRWTGVIYVQAAVDYAFVRGVVRKNGSTLMNPAAQWGNSASSNLQGYFGTGLLEFNGTTDYVEWCLHHDNSANAARNAQAANPNITSFELEFVRGPI